MSQQEQWLKAKLKIKSGETATFAQHMVELAPIVRAKLGWTLVAALQSKKDADVVVNIWRIPGSRPLAEQEKDLGQIDVVQQAMALVEAHLEEEIFEAASYHDDIQATSARLLDTSESSASDAGAEPYATSDNDVLIAITEQGSKTPNIYRVTERLWHQEGNLVPAPQANPIREKLLSAGVAVADIPRANAGGLTAICYLLNMDVVGPRR
ncbi:hypothetical protein WME99_10975 [Sorangium sp. So ce136]|uniref:hypothetical protein n=1 Tax=Sorangium sp. So ce136 TaxID=3133284 RepID=UPI003F09BA77